MKKNAGRYGLLDGIRGFALINMMVYHAVWDLVYLFGCNWRWYGSQGAYIWQQCICWTFILLSGFCQGLGRRRWQRGALVFGGGLALTVVTLIFMPENRVVFGVLTLIGSGVLLMIPLGGLLARLNPLAGLLGSLALFILARNVNSGYLGFEGWRLIALPSGWYQNLATAYLGFPPPGFYSTDYFALFPWIFLFLVGFFLCRLMAGKGWLTCLAHSWAKPLEWVGRHSLWIYMAHQPVIYLLLTLIFYWQQK